MKFFSKSRGDIALFLTLTSFALMVTGALVGSQLVKQGPRINPQAAVINWDWYSASTKCQDPATRSRTCGGISYAACICCEISLAYNDRDAGFCAPANITNTGNPAQICQSNPWDTSWGCWKYINTIAPTNTPPPQPTTRPQPTLPPGQPTVPPGQPTVPPGAPTQPPAPTNCNTCTECIWNKRPDVVNAHDPSAWPRNTCADKDAIVNDWCLGGMGKPAADDCSLEKSTNCTTECAGGGVNPTNPPAPSNPPASSPGVLACSDPSLDGTCILSSTCLADFSSTVYTKPTDCNISPNVCCVQKIKLMKNINGQITFKVKDPSKIASTTYPGGILLLWRSSSTSPTWIYQKTFNIPPDQISDNYTLPYQLTTTDNLTIDNLNVNGQYAVYARVNLINAGSVGGKIDTGTCDGSIQTLTFGTLSREACVFPWTGGNSNFTIDVDQTAPPAGTGTISGKVIIVNTDPSKYTLTSAFLGFDNVTNPSPGDVIEAKKTLSISNIISQTIPYTLDRWLDGSLLIKGSKIPAILQIWYKDQSGKSIPTTCQTYPSSCKELTVPSNTADFTITIPGSGAPAPDTISGNVTLNANAHQYDRVWVWKCDLNSQYDITKGYNCTDHFKIYEGSPRNSNITSASYEFKGLSSGTKYYIGAVAYLNNKSQAEAQTSANCSTKQGVNGTGCILASPSTQNFTITIPRPTGTLGGSFGGRSLSNAAWEAKINDYIAGSCDATCTSKFISENFLCHWPGLQDIRFDPNVSTEFIPPCYFQDVGAAI